MSWGTKLANPRSGTRRVGKGKRRFHYYKLFWSPLTGQWQRRWTPCERRECERCYHQRTVGIVRGLYGWGNQALGPSQYELRSQQEKAYKRSIWVWKHEDGPTWAEDKRVFRVSGPPVEWEEDGARLIAEYPRLDSITPKDHDLKDRDIPIWHREGLPEGWKDRSKSWGSLADIRQRSEVEQIRMLGLATDETWGKLRKALHRADGFALAYPTVSPHFVVVAEVPQSNLDSMQRRGFVPESINRENVLMDSGTDRSEWGTYDDDDQVIVDRVIQWLQSGPEGAEMDDDTMSVLVRALLLTKPKNAQVRRVGMHSKPRKVWCPGCGIYVWHTTHETLYKQDFTNPERPTYLKSQASIYNCLWCQRPTESVWQERNEDSKLTNRETNRLAEKFGLKSWVAPGGRVHLVNPPNKGFDFGALIAEVGRRLDELGIDVDGSEHNRGERPEVDRVIEEMPELLRRRIRWRERGRYVRGNALLDAIGGLL